MSIQELQNHLSNNNWISQKINEIDRWQCDNAVLMILDRCNKDPILIHEGDYGYLSNLDSCSFTHYRMILHWKNGEEWFFKY